MHIITVKLSLANVFLVRGEHWIIIDSGAPGDGPAILQAAARHGIAPADIGLILLTHGHIDHFGGAAELRASTGAPIAVHRADLALLRGGRNPTSLRSTGLEGQLLRPFLPWRTTPLEPDVTFEDSFDLSPFGIATRTVHTPGHSAGHSVLPLPDGNLIAGDLLRGGFLGGRLRGRLPNPPYFISDAARQATSLQLALSLPADTWHIGHGGPLAVEHIRARAKRLGLA
ncbi:MAG: MBL fold metallo-hydrolase [Chloroflexaceae bacterium]